MKLNQPAPDFNLKDLEGYEHSLADYRGDIVIINFWSAECPHAARVDLGLLLLIKEWGGKVHLLQIASNGNESLEMLKAVADERGTNPVLYDDDHKVADLYEATNTPHIYILDAEGMLQYHGAYDDMAFRQRIATRNYVEEAVKNLLKGSKPQVTHVLPFGCTIARVD
ncbi:MAG: redoxin domain-containing protein [Anaerolineae bacterium]|jgi:thiol-disulfide isomerase/thioredoxin|nr:redoxin domain-containing protein [Anaerolineae bacterium]MBT7076029.1 redoxin domain-containing protein [Anaerolineae bacterium]MBT7781379.1 redoxin domain-containing protein [Anaerolineae bacterium]